MKIDKRKPSHWLLLLQQAAYTLLAILLRPFTGKPKKPIVILYGHQYSGNLKALYTEWKRNQTHICDFYFLTLDPRLAQKLHTAEINVLQCNLPRDMLTLSRASALVSDHGLHLMEPLIRYSDLVLIDVWHGIPFKGFSPDDFRLQHRYDEVWVSSPLLKDIYEKKFGFKPDIVKDLGYARADVLFLQRPPDPLLLEKAGILPEKKVVLYAPTWQQDDSGRDLFPFGESQGTFIERLSATCKQHNAVLVIRSHLNASIDTKFYDNVRYCSMKEFSDTEGLLLMTDILICDWSSIAFDYLALNRPTIFLDVEPPFKNGFSLGREYRFGKIVAEMDSLCAVLNKTMGNPQWYTSTQRNKHQKIISAVYGNNTDGKSAERQLASLTETITRVKNY
jgi:CDP-glycerol glycerophosphotransferase